MCDKLLGKQTTKEKMVLDKTYHLKNQTTVKVGLVCHTQVNCPSETGPQTKEHVLQS